MDLKGFNVLVTGGAGFIGSHIADRCLELGANVKVLDNFITGDYSNLSSPTIEVIEGDIRDRKTVEKASRKADIIFHQAAQLNPAKAVEDPYYDFEVNVIGGVNVLLTGLENKVKKIVLASTNVYAKGAVGLLKESTPSLYLANTILSPYAAAKVSMEAYAKVLNDEYNIPTVRLRYSNVIGPRQRTKTESGVIALFIKNLYENNPLQIYGDGEQKRDFVDVEDVVQANLLAVFASKANGHVFNIASGKETSLNELVKKIASYTNLEPKIEHLPVRAADYAGASIDLTHSAKMLGYRPKFTFDQSLHRYINWYKELNGIKQ